MLWDLIFEFYVRYIFGGYIETGTPRNNFSGVLGYFWHNDNGNFFEDIITTDSFYINLGTIFDSGNQVPMTTYMPIGNYFSFIATIITMIIILIVIGHFIKKAFNLFGRII